MHVKGLNLPLEVEDVLDLVIEPPEHQRVVSAIKALEQVGALDSNKNLTSLGRVLLQLPVEAAIGKLTLLGCFFRCLGE
jgi:HrpA-like RNA helicase